MSRDQGGAGDVQVTMLEQRAGCRNCHPGHLSSKISFFKQVTTVQSRESLINNAPGLWLHYIYIKKCPPIKICFINIKRHCCKFSQTIPSPPFPKSSLLWLQDTEVALSLERIWAWPLISLSHSVSGGLFRIK